MSNVNFDPADINSLMKDISNQTINNESEGQLQQIAHANYIQLTIHEIWREMLGLSEFGLTDDLFDIGGDSVTAIQIFSEINKVFGVRLTMEELFAADIFSVIWLSQLVEGYLVDLLGKAEFEAMMAEAGNLTES